MADVAVEPRARVFTLPRRVGPSRPSWSRSAPSTPAPTSTSLGWLAALRLCLAPWALARVAVGLGYLVARIASDELIPRVAYAIPTERQLLAWDGGWYEQLAQHGYRADLRSLRFFPLFPMLGRALGEVVPGGVPVALALLANLAALAAGVVLVRLVVAEGWGRPTAVLAAWLLFVVPAAAPLVLAYAESLGLLLSLVTFVGLRRQRWHWAAVAGFLAALTRPLGLLLVLPAAIEAARGWRSASPRQRLGRLAAVAAPVAGTVAYLGWVQAAHGDWRQPYRLQTTIYQRELAEPLTRLVQSGYDLVAGHHASGLPLPWALLSFALLVVCLRRLPASYTVYAAVVLLVTTSSANLDSFERYALSAFPLIVAGALSIGRWPKLERPVISTALAGLTVYATAIFAGAKVP